MRAAADVAELEVREDLLHLRRGEGAGGGLAAAHDRADVRLLVLVCHRRGDFGGDTKAFASHAREISFVGRRTKSEPAHGGEPFGTRWRGYRGSGVCCRGG